METASYFPSPFQNNCYSFSVRRWEKLCILWDVESSTPGDMVTFFRKHPIFFHLLCWLVYMQFTYLYNLPKIEQVVYIHIAGLCLLYAAIFYANLFLLRYIDKKRVKWWGICILLIVLFFFSAAVGYIAIYHLFPNFGIKLYYDHVPFKTGLYLRNILPTYIKYTSYALIYYFVLKAFGAIQYSRQVEKARYEMERERFEFEQAMLRAQINPHFLHNTLNFIYTEALTLSKSLSDSIYKLSVMMRYFLENAAKGKQLVPLHKELEYLNIYLEINNRRFGGAKKVTYQFEGDPYGHAIPPLTFITLVENAFKYGDLSDPMSPMTIKIMADRRRIYFYCSNKKKTSVTQETGNHIGLKNLTKRIKAVFRDRAKISHSEENGIYTVELLIDLAE